MKKYKKKTMRKMSGEEAETIAEENSAEIRRKRMASILKRDLSRYRGRKGAVIVYGDYVVEAIWIKEGGKKLLYELMSNFMIEMLLRMF